MEYATLLHTIGLSESESNLYLASLRLGPSTAIQLASQVGMSRQIIYTLAESLMEQDLMEQVSSGSKRLFQAAKPDKLLERATAAATQLEQALPFLKAQEAASNALPALSVYENPFAIHEWYRHFMREAKKGEEVLTWSLNKPWSLEPDYLRQFTAFKKQNRIQDRVIAPDSLESRRFAHNLRQPHAQYRYVAEWWQSDVEKWVWRDTVGFLTIRDNATNLVVAESASLAAIERFNFWHCWKSAGL